MIASNNPQNHQTVPHCNVMTVTPSMALRWLENANTHNRKVSDAQVRQFARDIQQGNWVLTHEGIAFDPHGILLDGQHRLWAIVQAEVSVEMPVWFNITPQALEVINGGRSRSLADRIRLSHHRHGLVTPGHVATLKAMMGGMSGPAVMTSSEASQAMCRHREAVNLALKLIPSGRYIANAATRGVIARASYSADPERLALFAEMLCTGVVPDPNDTAVILLRQYLYNTPGGAHHLQRERYAKTGRALMAFLGREPITRLMPARQELFALPEEIKA